MEGVSQEVHKQYFHDIAVNAKGITKSLTSSFDRRQVQNRLAALLAETHPLLVGRVDVEKDTVRGASENWISGKNLIDVVVTTCFGMGKTLTAKRRAILDADAANAVTTAFLDAISSQFTALSNLAADNTTPEDVRQRSLLGSPTIIRGLAGAYSEIAVDKSAEGRPHITAAGDSRMRDLFCSLDNEMGLPISETWWKTGLFEAPDSKAPGSRSQNLRQLSEVLVRWARTGVPTS